MGVTLAFDIYGTLINTNGVLNELEKQVGEKAPELSRIWRDKQLEYSFRRGLMKRHVDFSVCTQQALEYAATTLRVSLSESQKKELMDRYKVLPAFDDVKEGLKLCENNGFRIFAFSNGSTSAVEELLINAGVRDYFTGVVSASTISSFKPDPGVYNHFLDSADAAADNAWMVSSNSFDVIGAVSAGMKAVWVKRSKGDLIDPWEIEPTKTINKLTDLVKCVKPKKR